jgi:hypothetical protein
MELVEQYQEQVQVQHLGLGELQSVELLEVLVDCIPEEEVDHPVDQEIPTAPEAWEK